MTRSGNSRLNLMASIVIWIGIIAGIIYFSNRRSEQDVGPPHVKTRDDILRERAEADAERPQQTLIEASEANRAIVTIQAEKSAVPKVRMKLAEAIKRGKVKVSVKGGGLEHVSLTIELANEETEASLEIEIEAGTVFASSKSTIQNMMANKNVVVELTSLRPELSISISVSCMNMHRKEPGELDSLTITKQESEDLMKLAANKNFQLAGERERQFAVWTVTDNPKRNGYVGIGNFGLGSGPDEKELSAIRTLLKESGIDPQKYQAFGGTDPLVAASRAKRKMEQEKETAEQQRRYRLIAVTATDSGTPIYGVMFASPSAANLTEKDLEDIGRSVKQAPRAIVWFYLPGMNAATQKPWATVTFKSSRTNTEIYSDRRPK